MCLCLPLLYLSVFDTDILPKAQTDFLWTYMCFLLALWDSRGRSWLLNTHMQAHRHLVLFLLQTLTFSDFFKNHTRNGSREENRSLKQHPSADKRLFPLSPEQLQQRKPSSSVVMCIPDHSCFSHIPKDKPALPFTASAPTAGSSMWAGSLKQLEN